LSHRPADGVKGRRGRGYASIRAQVAIALHRLTILVPSAGIPLIAAKGESAGKRKQPGLCLRGDLRIKA
jgi:hypothetical protein